MSRTSPIYRRHDRGAYTAELAVALPALVSLVAACMLGIGYAAATLRCDDAARAGARAAARGEPKAAVEAATRSAAPRRAHIQVRQVDDMAEVRCSAEVRLAGLHAFQVRARAVAPTEDTSDQLAPPAGEVP